MEKDARNIREKPGGLQSLASPGQARARPAGGPTRWGPDPPAAESGLAGPTHCGLDPLVA